MAEPFIKIKKNLVNDSDIYAMAEFIGNSEAVCRQFAAGYQGVLNDLLLPVGVRHLTVTFMMEFWTKISGNLRLATPEESSRKNATLRHYCITRGSDGTFPATEKVCDAVLKSGGKKFINDLVSAPGFADALADVGWLFFDDEHGVIILPNYYKHNVMIEGRSALTPAERSRRYREKQKEKKLYEKYKVFKNENPENVTEKSRDVTVDKNRIDKSDGPPPVPPQKADGNEPSNNPEKNAASPPVAGTPATVEAVVNLYHEMFPELREVKVINSTRRGYIKQRVKNDLPVLEHWRNYFKFVRQSAFLMGEMESGNDDRPPFSADIEFLTKPGSYAKIIERKYHHTMSREAEAANVGV